MEQIIPLVAVLFVLSLICERIATFIKLYLPTIKIKGKVITYRTNERSLDPEREKQRELDILKINLACGFLTAALLNANFFSIIRNMAHPSEAIGWNYEVWIWEVFHGKELVFKILEMLAGWVFTGAFISMGSKFWHDMLDLLLEIKKTRQLLNEDEMKKLSEGNFSSLSEEKQHALILELVKEKGDELRSTYSGITGLMIGRKEEGNQEKYERSLVFQVNEKLADPASPVPKTIPFRGFKVPTDVKPSGITMPQGFPGQPNPMLLGSGISREGYQKVTGSVGLKVYRKVDGVVKEFLLSCFHVVFHREMSKSHIREVKETDLLEDSRNIICPGYEHRPTQINVVGEAYSGKISNCVDLALVEINETVDLKNQLPDEHLITQVYYPQTTDLGLLQLKCNGTVSGKKKSILRSLYSEQPIPYTSQLKITLKGLYAIDRCTEPGDSGCPVIDMYGKLVGLVVGADMSYTYVIPALAIEEEMKVQTGLKH